MTVDAGQTQRWSTIGSWQQRWWEAGDGEYWGDRLNKTDWGGNGVSGIEGYLRMGLAGLIIQTQSTRVGLSASEHSGPGGGGMRSEKTGSVSEWVGGQITFYFHICIVITCIMHM